MKALQWFGTEKYYEMGENKENQIKAIQGFIHSKHNLYNQ